MDTPSAQDGPGLGSSRERRGVRWPFRCLALALLLYPLSSGPAAKLDSKGFLPSGAYATLYGPLMYFAAAAGLGRALDWYIWDLWNVRSSYPELSTPPFSGHQF